MSNSCCNNVLLQVVTDFFDEMKSRSRGYASMEYHLTGYRKNDLVRLDVKINNEVLLAWTHASTQWYSNSATPRTLSQTMPAAAAAAGVVQCSMPLMHAQPVPTVRPCPPLCPAQCGPCTVHVSQSAVRAKDTCPAALLLPPRSVGA